MDVVVLNDISVYSPNRERDAYVTSRSHSIALGMAGELIDFTGRIQAEFPDIELQLRTVDSVQAGASCLNCSNKHEPNITFVWIACAIYEKQLQYRFNISN